MAIRISYTPITAVGELAQKAGAAQGQIRSEQYAFQREMQANEIDAQQKAQQRDIQFKRQQYMANFIQNLQAQTISAGQTAGGASGQVAAAGAQASAQIFAAKSASRINQERLAQDGERLEFNQKLNEQAHQLETATMDRLEKKLTQDLAIQKEDYLQGFTTLQAQKEKLDQSAQDWISNKNWIVAEQGMSGYLAGLTAIQQGKTPAVRSRAAEKTPAPEKVYSPTALKTIRKGLNDRLKKVSSPEQAIVELTNFFAAAAPNARQSQQILGLVNTSLGNTVIDVPWGRDRKLTAEEIAQITTALSSSPADMESESSAIAPFDTGNSYSYVPSGRAGISSQDTSALAAPITEDSIQQWINGSATKSNLVRSTTTGLGAKPKQKAVVPQSKPRRYTDLGSYVSGMYNQ